MARTWIDREKESGFTFKTGERRIILLSHYISPEDKSVIDLGAGNLFLKSLLSEEVDYYPVDYTSRSENTIVCDFNKEEFPDVTADAAFISGTLEFVNDPEWFLSEAAKRVSKIILSYNTVPDNTPVNIEARRQNAWLNDLTKNDVIKIMHSKGFLLDRNSAVLQNELVFCFLKASPETLNRNYFCPGCGACTNVCPVNALLMTPDTEGFYRPVTDVSKCTSCGQCADICPAINTPKYETIKNPECFEFIAKNDEVLYQSSSGGAFTLMAKKILQDGGLVCGVAWRDDFSVAHIMIDNENDLHKIQKSKYMQSYVGDIHKQVKTKLESGKTVLFSGCPCHVAGLHAFLKKTYDNLYSIDLLCSNAPSSGFFRKYLHDTFGAGRIKKYEFRHKAKGWNDHTHAIQFSDGTASVRRFEDDPWQRVYHKRLMSSDACNWCRFSLVPRPADLTIGDFWWIDKNDKKLDPNYKKGISAVLINSAKGQKLFEAIMPEGKVAKKVPIEWLWGNGSVFKVRNGEVNEMRDKFFSLIKGMTFPKAVDVVTNKHFDIGVMGWWYGANFGSVLTYYALHQVLVNMGYSVLMIKEAIGYNERTEMPDTSSTMAFARKHYSYSPHRHYNDFAQYNEKCDIFLTGSDQQWNYKVPFVNEDFFLNFVESDKKKIAYGVSFGQKEHNPPRKVKNRHSYLIQQYDAISVREDYAVDIAKNIYGADAVNVLDPVFLLDTEEYNMLTKEATFRHKGDFLAAYILEVTPAKRDIVCEIARRLCLDVVVIPDIRKTWSADVNIRNEAKNIFGEITVLDHITPENFIYIYRHCKYVVTDSFHGTCFSYIYRKSFSVFYNKLRGVDRFKSLMRIIKLEERQIHENFDVNSITDKMLQPIDFSYAESQITAMREKSVSWLKNALEKPKENKPTDYGFFKTDINTFNSKLDHMALQLSTLRMGLETVFLPLEGPLATLALLTIRENKFQAYLNILPSLAKNFLVIIAVRDTPGYHIDRGIVLQLQKAGFKENLQYKHLCSYIGVIDKGKLMFESLSKINEQTQWDSKIDSYQIKVVSRVWGNGDIAEIKINDMDYAVNGRGLNIVTFDKRSGCFIDSVCFDTHLSTCDCSRGSTQKWVEWFSFRAATFHRLHDKNRYLDIHKMKTKMEIKSHKDKKEGIIRQGWGYLKLNGFRKTLCRVKKYMREKLR